MPHDEAAPGTGPHVEVIGIGTASGAPDTVAILARVQCEAPDVAAALADAGGRASGIAQASRDHDVAATDIQTQGAGVQPQRDRDGQRVIGYTAYQSVRVRVRDQSRVGDLIAAWSGVAGNAVAIDNISLELSDEASLLRRARDAAFADALAKAKQYAELAGRTLDEVLWVNDVPARGAGSTPRYEMMAAVAGTYVAMGEHTVTAQVAVRWEWT
jgi:uncharacterized protein YggE